jgi:hypothetical protein
MIRISTYSAGQAATSLLLLVGPQTTHGVEEVGYDGVRREKKEKELNLRAEAHMAGSYRVTGKEVTRYTTQVRVYLILIVDNFDRTCHLIPDCT